MQFRLCLKLAVAALVSLIGVQSASFAGAASRQGFVSGHIRTFGSHHIRVRQPAPVQAVATVNVRDFGATGNGVTDDTGAIQNAIAAAHASGKGVLFPAGTYLHNIEITANGVGLFGVGAASVLLAGSSTNSAVILTGVNPSIQNLVINTQFVGQAVGPTNPTNTCLTVKDCQGFVVQGITILQGLLHTGVYQTQSGVGQVSGVALFGAGGGSLGFLTVDCANVSIVGNSISNVGQGMATGGMNGISQSIAIVGNNVSASGAGIGIGTMNLLDIEQNQILLTNTTSPNAAIFANGCSNFSITNNQVLGSSNGIQVSNAPGSSGIVSQNVIQNCGQKGISVLTSGGGVQVLGNKFGECGLLAGPDVIDLTPSGGPGSIVVLNNVYAGHANNLTNFIKSAAHRDVVSGNAQTQTTLSNILP